MTTDKTQDVLYRLAKREVLTWDVINEIPEEELRKVISHIIKTDTEFQEAIAAWLTAWYKAAAATGRPSKEMIEALEKKVVDKKSGV
jgi:hypothetical protein